ncbi:MAG TPA: exodeoxyribonuclease VII large subunit [Salinivirgaceae bacterium]|nr:exodeoxyribonuclease VII large subunit [Salinivirgaceae bacterium]
MDFLSLSEFSLKIKNAVNEAFPLSVGLIAEISELNHNRSGHCFIELVEQKENQIVAKIKGIIYNNRYPLLQSYFKSVTGSEFTVGMKVLFTVRAVYHPLFGLSVEIVDIDPKYTLGDLEQKRRLIIERLVSEGVFEMNQQLEIPPIIKNIAVVSSPTAAGWGDFLKHLKENPYGLSFHVDLFEAYMQGDQTVESITKAFHGIFDSLEQYDVVVILRGGGSKAELAVFDDYDLVYMITQFPLPVITGIGHDRDMSICDLVANMALKTPTAVADFIIDTNVQALSQLDELRERLKQSVFDYFSKEKQFLQTLDKIIIQQSLYSTAKHQELLSSLHSRLRSIVQQAILKNRNQLTIQKIKLSKVTERTIVGGVLDLTHKQKHLATLVKMQLQAAHVYLGTKEKEIDNLNPINILKRGFGLISKDGVSVTSVSQINPSDSVKIDLFDGSFDAHVSDIKMNH